MSLSKPKRCSLSHQYLFLQPFEEIQQLKVLSIRPTLLMLCACSDSTLYAFCSLTQSSRLEKELMYPDHSQNWTAVKVQLLEPGVAYVEITVKSSKFEQSWVFQKSILRAIVCWWDVYAKDLHDLFDWNFYSQSWHVLGEKKRVKKNKIKWQKNEDKPVSKSSSFR